MFTDPSQTNWDNVDDDGDATLIEINHSLSEAQSWLNEVAFALRALAADEPDRHDLTKAIEQTAAATLAVAAIAATLMPASMRLGLRLAGFGTGD